MRFGAAGASATMLGRLGFAQGTKAIPLAMVDLSMQPEQFEIYSGWQTDCYRFRATAKSASNVVTDSGSYLGPTLRFKKGQFVRATIRNNLNANSVVHWHGLHLPEAADGLPTQIVGPGTSYTRSFQVINRAGTYWYHPHPHMSTAYQVYRGLAGLVIVSDDEEQALGLPRGEYDVPLVIQDRRFNAQYQYVYSAGSMMGMLGNVMCVNGRPNYVLSAATRAYRLRILNGSNSRIYKLAWSNELPLYVIGTDGGLLRQPVKKPYIMLSPGERVELWADFTDQPVGTEFVLKSLAFSGVGQNSGQTPVQGAPLDLMRVRIDRAEAESLQLPTTLSNFEWEDPMQAVNRLNPRHFPISFGADGWVLNGATYDPTAVAANERVRLGDLEIWEFSHVLNSMSLSAHPIHIHGAQFQIIERTIQAERAAAYETVRYGYTDEGWKDTFLMMPGETVRLLMRFTRYPGTFLYHCHNLEHEDMGMMRNYQIVP